jgi:pyruvate dehydrogenase E2 component (dihydrolipoamide acetyltransferase)
MAPRFVRPAHVSAFRTLAAVAWYPPLDPTIYGESDVDATALQRYVAEVRERTGQKVTITHCVARAFAMVLRENPALNCTIRRGRIWQRTGVDVFCQVAVPPDDKTKLQGADLSGAVLRDCDRLVPAAIARTMAEIAEKIRKRDDPMLKQTKRMFEVLPAWGARLLMRWASWITHDLGISLKSIGIPDDPFGSVMVTSLGMMGIRKAYAPLFPTAKGIGVVLVGGVYEGVVAVAGKPEVRPLLPLTIAIDHRLIDGFQASVLAREVVKKLTEPELLERDPA